jgi:hypothetical protein
LAVGGSAGGGSSGAGSSEETNNGGASASNGGASASNGGLGGSEEYFPHYGHHGSVSKLVKKHDGPVEIAEIIQTLAKYRD